MNVFFHSRNCELGSTRQGTKLSKCQWYHEHLSPRKHWGYDPPNLVSQFYGTEGQGFESLRARNGKGLLRLDLSVARDSLNQRGHRRSGNKVQRTAPWRL
jgi:hypothetical protein